MTTTITFPTQTATPVPLPNLGRCADCPDEIRLRNDNRLYAHGCTGDGAISLLILRPTFARWLWAQSRRRDDHANRLTLTAGRIFRPCTCSPKRTAADVDWETADQLHGRLHQQQLVRTGSELRQPYNGERCDWFCRDVAEAAAIYARLAEESAMSRVIAHPGGC